MLGVLGLTSLALNSLGVLFLPRASCSLLLFVALPLGYFMPMLLS